MSDLLHWAAGLPPWLALAVLALSPMLEASLFLGVILPGETALILVGVLVHEGRLGFAPAMIVCSLAAIAGDAIGYAIGRHWGERIMSTKLARKRFIARRWARARTYLKERGSWSVFLGRFAVGVRTFVPMMAGTARMPLKRFLAANIAGGVLWSVVSIVLGWIAGAAWEKAHWIVFAAAALLTAGMLWMWLRKKR